MPVIVQTRSIMAAPSPESLLVVEGGDAYTDERGNLIVVDTRPFTRRAIFAPGEWLSAYVAEDTDTAIEAAKALSALLRTTPLGPSEPDRDEEDLAFARAMRMRTAVEPVVEAVLPFVPAPQLDHAPLLPLGTAVYALDVLSDLTMPAWKDFLVGKTERPKDPLPYCDLEDDHWWRPLGPRPDGFGMEPFVWRASRANLVGYAERTAPAKGDLVLIGAGATLAVGEVGTQVWHDNRARLGHVVEPEDDEGDVLVNTEDGERYVAARFVQVIDPFDAL